MNTEAMLTSAAAIATIIGTVFTLVCSFFTWKKKKIVQKEKKDILLKYRFFDYQHIVETAKKIESNLTDWKIGSYTKRGLNRDKMCKSVYDLLSELNQIVAKMEGETDAQKSMEEKHKIIRDLIDKFGESNSVDNKESVKIAEYLLTNISDLIRIFTKLLYN